MVKLCVQVLVSLSKESEFSVEDTEKHKTISIAIRGMANKLDSGLIKVFPLYPKLLIFIFILQAA